MAQTFRTPCRSHSSSLSRRIRRRADIARRRWLVCLPKNVRTSRCLATPSYYRIFGRFLEGYAQLLNEVLRDGFGDGLACGVLIVGKTRGGVHLKAIPLAGRC